MIKINEHTIINLEQIALININSNYLYLNGETLKVTDKEMEFILSEIKEVKEYVKKETTTKESSRKTKKV